MAESLAITEEQRDGCVKFTLKGPVNTLGANALQYRLDDTLDAGCVNIVANMAQVSYLSSSGIRVLLSTYKKALKQEGQFRIERPSENVKNVLGMTALDEMLVK